MPVAQIWTAWSSSRGSPSSCAVFGPRRCRTRRGSRSRPGARRHRYRAILSPRWIRAMARSFVPVGTAPLSNSVEPGIGAILCRHGRLEAVNRYVASKPASGLRGFPVARLGGSEMASDDRGHDEAELEEPKSLVRTLVHPYLLAALGRIFLSGDVPGQCYRDFRYSISAPFSSSDRFKRKCRS
jgi:hypothetical protein